MALSPSFASAHLEPYLLSRHGVQAMALSQFLAESPQDLSSVGRAQRLQGDRGGIPVDIEIPRGLENPLNQLAAFVFGAAAMGTDRTARRGPHGIGDDLHRVTDVLALNLQTES